jgi:hypothetical protein
MDLSQSSRLGLQVAALKPELSEGGEELKCLLLLFREAFKCLLLLFREVFYLIVTPEA